MNTAPHNPTVKLYDFWRQFVADRKPDVKFRIFGWTRVQSVDIVVLEQDGVQSEPIEMVKADGSNVLPASMKETWGEDGTFVYIRFLLDRPAFIMTTAKSVVEFG